MESPETPPVQPMPAPVQPAPLPVMPTSNLGVRLFGAGLIIIAIAIASYFYLRSVPPLETGSLTGPATAMPTPSASASATPDPTAGWKTYTNTRYAYSLKYPANWYVDTQYSENDFTLRGSDGSVGGDTKWSNYSNPGQYDPSTVPYDFAGFDLLIWKVDANTSLGDFVHQKWASSNQQPTTIAGVPAIIISSSGSPTIAIVFKYGAKVFDFTSERTTAGTTNAMLQQALSTFTFTAPTSAIPADWRTYTDQQIGYSISYPATFPDQCVDAPTFGSTLCGGIQGLNSQYPKTGFNGADFSVNILSHGLYAAKLNTEQKCLSFGELLADPSQAKIPTETRTIGGVIWYKNVDAEGAAGTIYTTIAYRTFHGGICWELSERRSEFAIENVDNYQQLGWHHLTQAQRDTIDAKFLPIIDSFQFTK